MATRLIRLPVTFDRVDLSPPTRRLQRSSLVRRQEPAHASSCSSGLIGRSSASYSNRACADSVTLNEHARREIPYGFFGDMVAS